MHTLVAKFQVRTSKAVNDIQWVSARCTIRSLVYSIWFKHQIRVMNISSIISIHCIVFHIRERANEVLIRSSSAELSNVLKNTLASINIKTIVSNFSCIRCSMFIGIDFVSELLRYPRYSFFSWQVTYGRIEISIVAKHEPFHLPCLRAKYGERKRNFGSSDSRTKLCKHIYISLKDRKFFTSP